MYCKRPVQHQTPSWPRLSTHSKSSSVAPCQIQVVSETIPALLKLKQEGLVRHIGITGLPLKIFPYVLDRWAQQPGARGGANYAYELAMKLIHCIGYTREWQSASPSDCATDAMDRCPRPRRQCFEQLHMCMASADA